MNERMLTIAGALVGIYFFMARRSPTPGTTATVVTGSTVVGQANAGAGQTPGGAGYAPLGTDQQGSIIYGQVAPTPADHINAANTSDVPAAPLHSFAEVKGENNYGYAGKIDPASRAALVAYGSSLPWYDKLAFSNYVSVKYGITSQEIGLSATEINRQDAYGLNTVAWDPRTGHGYVGNMPASAVVAVANKQLTGAAAQGNYYQPDPLRSGPIPY